MSRSDSRLLPRVTWPLPPSPARGWGRVLAAKAALVAGVLHALALASCTAAYLLGDAVLDGTHPQGDPLPALLGIAALFSAVGLLGLARS